MPAPEEYSMMRKATVYDLIRIFKADPKISFTKDEIEAIMNAYVKGSEK